MGTSKIDLYQSETLELAEQLKAIGHPARIKIILHLLETPGCICGELVEVVGLSQPTISQHLKALKEAHWISGTVEGTSTCYCINVKTLEHFKTLLSPLLDYKPSSKTCC